jgi:hypothetical protein
MTNPSRSRDAFRLGVTSVTALVGAGTLTAVGWFAGTAARQHQAAMAADAHAQAVADAKAARAKWRYDVAMAKRRSASFRPRVILKQRPTRTVVSTQYVSAATTPVTVGGGTFAAPSAPAPAAAPAAAAPQAAAPAPPPPPPPPPPAPSTGSHHAG